MRLPLRTALAALALGVVARPVPTRAQPAARDVEPVVLTGARLPAWSRLAATIVCAPYPSGTTGGRDAHNGTVTVPADARPGIPVDEIAAYRWDGLQYVEIPVQVDERFFHCLSNPPSDFAFYSGTDKRPLGAVQLGAGLGAGRHRLTRLHRRAEGGDDGREPRRGVVLP